MSEETDEDGYVVVPALKDAKVPRRGIKCGQCGMKFDDNTAYGYVCMKSWCPIYPKTYSVTSHDHPHP